MVYLYQFFFILLVVTAFYYLVTSQYKLSWVSALVTIGKSIQKAIAVVVITIVLLYMTPVVVDAVDAINTTGWTFTGYQGAIAILGLVPFLWVASILGFSAYAMFSIAKDSSD